MLCADYGRIHTPSNYVGKSRKSDGDGTITKPQEVIVRRNGKVIVRKERLKQ